MIVFSRLLSIIKWVFLALMAYILFVEVVLRIVRRYYQFPIPYYAARLIDNPIRRRIQPPEKIVEWMGVKPGMRLLEVGPGPGTFTFAAARSVGETGRVYEIDIQESIVSGLNKKIGQQDAGNITAELASAYELPYPDGYFGAAFCSHVLEHLPRIEDAFTALDEMERVADSVFTVSPHKISLIANIYPGHNLWITPSGDGYIIEQRKQGTPRKESYVISMQVI